MREKSTFIKNQRKKNLTFSLNDIFYILIEEDALTSKKMIGAF